MDAPCKYRLAGPAALFLTTIHLYMFADEIGEMEFPIACSPEAHPVIKETGGVRKARWRERALEKAAAG